MSFAVWLTGYPASGKSAIAKALLALLHARGVDCAHLESDVLRTQLTPFARYDDAERDFFYATLAEWAAQLAARGVPVVVDATANRRRYRDAARDRIERFAEVFVDTPLEVCAARDPKGLYRAAGKGQASSLPGPQADYEPPRAPEVIVSGEKSSPSSAAGGIVGFLEKKGWIKEN